MRTTLVKKKKSQQIIKFSPTLKCRKGQIGQEGKYIKTAQLLARGQHIPGTVWFSHNHSYMHRSLCGTHTFKLCVPKNHIPGQWKPIYHFCYGAGEANTQYKWIQDETYFKTSPPRKVPSTPVTATTGEKNVLQNQAIIFKLEHRGLVSD